MKIDQKKYAVLTPSVTTPTDLSKVSSKENTLGMSGDQSRSTQSEPVSVEWWCIDLGQAVTYSQEKIERFAEACFRFTPDVVIGKNRIFLEMGRTKKMFNLDSVQKRVDVLAAREGLRSQYWQWGIGKTLPESWVQVRWKSVSPHLLIIDSIFDYIDPLWHQNLNRRDLERVNLFWALGVKSLQDLFKIPQDALLTRFGTVFDQFSKNFFEGKRFPWARFVPSVELLEQSAWNSDDWVGDSESLIFRVKPIVDRMMARLFSLRKSMKKMELTMRLDSRSPDRVITLQFAFPQTSSQLLLKVLREKISFEMQKNPLTDPIIGVSFKVLETTERDQRTLRMVFSEADSAEVGEDLREKWMELISYLGVEFGDEADAQENPKVFQAEVTENLVPELSWKKVLLSDPSVSAPLDEVSRFFAKRPLRLLSEPVKLSREGTFLKYQDEPWRICEFSCEERLSGYEWDVEGTDGFDRTYYRVKVENPRGSMAEWWIYKDAIFNKLMLHGMYA